MNINEFISRIDSLNLNDIATTVFNELDLSRWIEKTITDEQLNGYQEDSEGKKLPLYSPTSKSVYGKSGNWTLYDTGEFYGTVKATLIGNSLEIIANDDGKRIFDRLYYGYINDTKYSSIIALNKENFIIFIENFRDGIIKRTKEELLR